MNSAHSTIHKGTGGRTNLVQELYKKWKTQLPTEKLTDEQRWKDFKEFYHDNMHELDKEGLIRSKTKHAKSTISPEHKAFMDQTTSNFVEMQEQLDTVSQAMIHAMSIYTQNTPQKPSVPPLIQAGTTAASTLTDNQSYR